MSFEPYTDNGGTIVAIAGEDYCLIAADTRQSEGYSINTRYAPKAHPLSDGTVLANVCYYADAMALVKNIKQRLQWYHHQHEKTMSTPAMAQMLSTMLYGKRFFPYYVYNILGGLDEKGKGCVYGYDPVGNVERVTYATAGSASKLIEPFLDNQVGFKNQANEPLRLLPQDVALKLVKDAFSGATERDIHTGDFLELYIVTKAGVQYERSELKKD